MPATPADLFALLDRLGLATETVEHPAVFTVEDSRRLRGELPGGHTKNLFLKDRKGRLFLVTALEGTTIDLKRLHVRIGAAGRLSFGSAEQLGEALGVAPGSVTPFAAMNDRDARVTVVLDEGLMAHGRVHAHPLVNTATTAIAPADLVAFLRATGHTPRLVALGPADAAAGIA